MVFLQPLTVEMLDSYNLIIPPLQLHCRQPDESGHHAFRGGPRRSHHPAQPLPQLPLAPSQHARLQPGKHIHHRSCDGPTAADTRRAAGS